jgi:hypothetical protein
VRLISAIPLLFWVGTAAVAHLAHVWALVPAAVTPVAQASETALGADVDAAAHAPAGHFFIRPEAAALQPWPDRPVQTAIPASVDAGVRGPRLEHQILSAARLSGNPPPRRA